MGNYRYLPIADIGDCSMGVTVTVIGVADVPPIVLTTTSINPDDSKPVNHAEANSTTNPRNTYNVKSNDTYVRTVITL